MSYISAHFHCVFSTKERRPLIIPELRDRLWPFLGGIARQNKMKAIEIGGVEDHIHILLSLPSTIAIAKAMQLIKGGSSKWVHETFPQHGRFAGEIFIAPAAYVVARKNKQRLQTKRQRPRSSFSVSNCNWKSFRPVIIL